MSLFGGGGGANTVEPRLGSFKVMAQGYGVTIPVVMGTNRLQCVLVDYMDFYSIANTTQSGGGKGGGGGGGNTSFTYYATIVLLCCESGGYGVDFGRLWVNKDLYAAPDLKGFSGFDGADGQMPWAYMTGKHPGHAMAYKNFAYMAAHDYQLTRSASLGNHAVEINGFYASEGGGRDASVANCITGLLLDRQWGCDFGAEKLLPLTQLDNYCGAYGIVISPALTEQIAAHELVTRWAAIANASIVWTQNADGTAGGLKFIPYSRVSVTANGYTYNPVAPLDVHLGDDDFVDDGDSDPIICTQANQAEAFNAIAVEFKARDHEYNKMKTPEARDTADIVLNGYRPGAVFVADEITLIGVAQTVSQNLLQRSVYVRNSYEGRLIGWQYAYLEPMDVVYLTDPGLGLVDSPVLIISIADDNDELSVTYEDLPDGSEVVTYAAASVFATRTLWNTPVGDINPPVIFHAPAALSKGGFEVWIAVSHADINYGGCQVWTSFTDDNYKLAGIMSGKSVHGVLAAAFAGNPDPDRNAAHTLSVDLSASGGSLSSVSHDNAVHYRSLCLVGDELVAYRDATNVGGNYDLLTPNPPNLSGVAATDVVSSAEIQFSSLNRDTGYYDGGTLTCTAGTTGNVGVTRTVSSYTFDTDTGVKTVHCAAFPNLPDRNDVFTLQALPYVRRGLYVQDSEVGAAAGARFVSCDDRLFKLPFLPRDIGATLFIKFLAYNQFGQALQSLADVTAYSIVLAAPPAGNTSVDAYYQWINE